MPQRAPDLLQGRAFAVSRLLQTSLNVAADALGARVADRFPDGQLYVNLRGFDPNGPATEPAEAVAGFLDALDVPADGMPADLPARVGLYRSLLAGRRMLVLMDNARNAEQVRPLLYGAPGCLVLVTSRNRMAGLAQPDCPPAGRCHRRRVS